MGEIKAIKNLPEIKDRLFVINNAFKSKTKAHKVEETIDKGSSCGGRSSGEYDKVEE